MTESKKDGMEIKGENMIATPRITVNIFSLPQIILRETGWRVEQRGDTTDRFCGNPCRGGNSVVLGS